MAEELDFDKDEIVSVLNDLIETCKDGQHEYHEAAGAIDDPILKEKFTMFSRQRERFASELQEEVRRLDGDAEESGHMTAAMHRGWINLKAAISGKEPGAILAEVQRGDNVAVESYHDALDNNLPMSLRNLIETQYDSIKHARDEMRDVELTRRAA